MNDAKRRLNTFRPGRVVRYYPDLQTIDVRPCVMRHVPGDHHEPDEFEDDGEYVNVPIQWPRAGGFVITFPIKAGDYVGLLFSDTNLLRWRGRGGVAERPGISDDEFGVNGIQAIPGCFPDAGDERLKSVSTEDFEIRRVDGGAVISVQPNGSVRITSGDVVVGNGPSPSAVALADLVKAEVQKAVLGHTHAVSGALASTVTLVAPIGDMGAQHMKAT